VAVPDGGIGRARRRVAVAVASCLGVVLAGLVLFAPSGFNLGGRRAAVTIRFWNGFTGPDGRAMLRIVQRFNAANPDVRVLMQRMDWATYYNKLMVAGMGGRAPDVFVSHADNMERLLRAEFLRPVDDLLSGTLPIASDDFHPTVWSAVEKGGAHYAVPLDIHVLGTFYNRALLREARIVDAAGEPKPPATRDEFVAAAAKLTRPGNPGQWGLVFTWLRTNAYAVMCQFGGTFFTPDGGRCVMNCPENVAALEFCADLIGKHKVAPSPENFDAWIGFRQGRVGMAFEGIYMLADLQRQKDLDYARATLPVLGTMPAAWAGAHLLCLRRGLEGAQLEAAWRFVKFLSDNSLDWAEGGQIPARNSLRDTDRFRSMSIQSEFAKELPHIVFMPRVPFIFEFYTEFDLAVERALRGSATAKAALDDAARRMNEVLERDRLAAGEAARAGGGAQ
jgi:multiple sugar transport system substrate-binding protein